MSEIIHPMFLQLIEDDEQEIIRRIQNILEKNIKSRLKLGAYCQIICREHYDFIYGHYLIERNYKQLEKFYYFMKSVEELISEYIDDINIYKIDNNYFATLQEALDASNGAGIIHQIPANIYLLDKLKFE